MTSATNMLLGARQRALGDFDPDRNRGNQDSTLDSVSTEQRPAHPDLGIRGQVPALGGLLLHPKGSPEAVIRQQ